MTNISGEVIASDKRIPVDSTQNVTYTTVEWTLYRRVGVKELIGRLVEYVSPNDELMLLLRLTQTLMLLLILSRQYILMYLTLSLLPKQLSHLLPHNLL